MDFIRIYNHVLGRNHRLEIKGKNAVGYCPFCEASALSIDVSNGKGQCWKCEESVNITSFITKYHKAWLDFTPDEYYEELTEARGISATAFKQAQFAYDGNNDKWLVPYRNLSTSYLTNLGNFRIEGDHAFKVFVLPNEGDMFPKGFYNPFTFTAKPAFKHQPLIITEGEWDALAMLDMVSDAIDDPNKRPAILGCPGASIIPKNAGEFLKGYKHSTTLTYDNDESGQAGLMKMATFLVAEKHNVSYLDWSALSEAANRALDKFDVRDILTKTKLRYPAIKKTFTALEIEVAESNVQELGPGFISTVENIEPVLTLDNYLDLYQAQMFLTQTNRDAIIATMAIAASVGLGNLPIWAFLVGNASSGKTTLIESYGGEHEWCNYASKLSAKSILSGMHGSGNSFIRFMNHKPFFIKDFTVVLGMSKDQQKELFDLLRDIYDGSVKVTWGNGKVENIQNINFPMIAGVTQAIYKVKTAELGERFLRINYSDEHPNDEVMDSVLASAIQGFGQSTNKKDALTKATIGYLKTVKENYWDSNLPVFSDGSTELIGSLAKYTAFLRANPEHHRTEGLLYRPKPEDPPRLAIQFTKLAYSLCKVFKPTASYGATLTLSDDVERIVFKSAIDTCYGFGQDIIKHLHANPKSLQSDISKYAHIDQTRCYRELTNLKTVGLIQTVTRSDGRGRPALLYKLSEPMQVLTDRMFPQE